MLLKKPKGFYIEIGANDGITQSNTFLLQCICGWNGMLIEPNPYVYQSCISNRCSNGPQPIFENVACSSFANQNTIGSLVLANEMSILEDHDVESARVLEHVSAYSKIASDSSFVNPSNVHMPTTTQLNTLLVTMSSLIDKHNIESPVDFLSIDVEGNEFSLLSGIDFSMYIFKYILVELSDGSPCFELLRRNNYEVVATLFSHGNCHDILFKHKSL